MSALTLALPSKGRLQEQVTEYLADAGIALKRASGARDYRATLEGMPGIEVKLLSSADIASALIAGDVHLGVTGEDLIAEESPGPVRAAALLQPLGFGFADVVVAVPKSWIDVSTMADLDDVCTVFHTRHHRRLRIATKYVGITRSFFAAHGIADYRIVESLGATEGAPSAGTAEAIVDITTTGATLAANGLKILDDGVILKSQAQLAASLKAKWDTAALGAAERLTARLSARELARGAQVLRAQAGTKSAKVVKSLVAKTGCTILSRPAGGAGDYAFLCPKEKVMDALELLRGAGVGAAVSAEAADYVFGEHNPAFVRLREAVAPKRRR
jgi:ATP phosphoribosyltransferase